MKKRFIARQGDVLILVVTDKIPEEAKKVERDNGKIVLAYGEATGHTHAIVAKGAILYAVNENLRMLQTEEAAELVHEEHATINLPAKTTFQIIRQKTYTPARNVYVAD